MMGYRRVCALFDLKVFRTNDGHCFPVHLSGTWGIRFPPNLLLSVLQIPKKSCMGILEALS
eukprot:164278-Pelagomonas_calceolata.AAC.1